MPCRVCNGRITKDQAANGLCPHCGAALRASRAATALPPRRGEVRARKGPVAKPSGNSTKWVIGGAIAASVLLLGVAGFVVIRAMLGGETEIDNTQIEIAKSPALPAEVEPAPVAPAVETVAMPEVPKAAESQPANAPQSNVAELLRQQQILQREDIVKRVDEALQLVKKVGYGHVVVGQIKMEGNASPRDVIAQMEILEDGYFVDAVATAGAPVYFWHSGYSRLDIVPKGQKGTIENLGEVMMNISNKPGGVVKGVMVANGSETPRDLKATVTYSLPIINKCIASKGDSSNAQKLDVEQELLARITATDAETVDIVPTTGAFIIANLHDLRFTADFHSADNDSWKIQMEVSPGEDFNLGLCSMGRAYDTQQVEVDFLKNVEWAQDGKLEFQRMLSKIADPAILRYFQQRFDKDLKAVERTRAAENDRGAVVIVGRIEVPGKELDGSQVEAQMLIAKDGYFCAGVRPGRAIGFRLHGYDPLDYVPKGSHDGVEYCGVLRMKKTAASDTASIHGTVVVENGQVPPELQITVKEKVINVNMVGGDGYRQDRGNPRPSQPRIFGSEFEVNKLSPIDYAFTISAPGFDSQRWSIRFQPGENRTMAPSYLFRTRAIKMSHVSSTAGSFFNVTTRSSFMGTNAGQWRSFEDPAVYNHVGQDLILLQSGNAVVARNVYQASFIADLGARNLEEFRSIETTRTFENSDGWFQDFVLREGHVYLLKQWAFKHWVLFKIDEISASVNAQN